ncbi:MAG TPA: pseudouridine-5'-phosphate glycosidase [Acidimicrobiales bacterium]
MGHAEETPVRIADEVRDAITDRRGVVALETTLLVHGLPPEDAVKVAADLEQAVRAAGAVPATVGMLEGVAVVGLAGAEIDRLVEQRATVRKLSTRDLGLAAASRSDGATTVAATVALAAAARIRVMATGGIGGVHLGARDTFDESADLVALSRTPVLVVASGVKSILDVAATLERLDTLGVPVAAYGSTSFPGFYVVDSGLHVEWSVDSPELVASAFAAHNGFGGGGMLLANPVPQDDQMDLALHDRALAEGLQLASERGLTGADVTPFLLDHFAQTTGGASVRANVALVLGNATLAGMVAVALVAHGGAAPSA